MTFPAPARSFGNRLASEGPARRKGILKARLEPHVEALRARGINARRGEGDAYEFITN